MGLLSLVKRRNAAAKSDAPADTADAQPAAPAAAEQPPPAAAPAEGADDAVDLVRTACLAAKAAKEEAGEAEHTVRVLGRAYESVHEAYSMGRELGRGQYGVIRACVEKATGVAWACKSISKARLAGAREVEDVRREVRVMQQLRGHPAIVALHATFEDHQ
ncbi:unnamed protein product, partial [Closterium sp. Naga37s-1]